jgi:hypothetical protein
MIFIIALIVFWLIFRLLICGHPRGWWPSWVLHLGQRRNELPQLLSVAVSLATWPLFLLAGTKTKMK